MLLRLCPPHLFVRHSRRLVLNYSSKSGATAAYEQLLREHAPLITYLDRSTVSGISLVVSFTYSVTAHSQDVRGDDGEGVQSRKVKKDLQNCLERFRTLKAVSRVRHIPSVYSSTASRHTRVQCSYMTLPSF